jgi:hypothetical protein
MEILRFEEAPTSAPKRKKSSRGFIALGFVATLFGVSTAFASSTIQINSDRPIALGQGVSAVLGCDSEIMITPDAGLTTATATPSPGPSPDPIVAPAPTFNLSKIVVGDIDTVATNNAGEGCGGVDFKIQVFHTENLAEGAKKQTAYTCDELGSSYLEGSFGDLTSLECLSSAIYFRVATENLGTSTNLSPGSVTLTLLGNSDIDYITLVSTNHAYQVIES